MHSHASKLTKQGDKKRVKEMTATDFVNCFIGKIDVFSVTDHNCFDSKYYGELYEAIEGKPIKLVKGTELDVYVDDTNFFQMGVYFEDSTGLTQIQTLISNMYINGAKPRLGDIIQELFSLKKRFLIMPEADKSHGIRSVWNALKKNGDVDRFLFNGRHRIFNGYDSSDNFNIEGASNWALNYYQKTKEFESITGKMNQDEVEDLLSQIKKKIKNESFELTSCQIIKVYNTIKEYGQSFTYFSFSDWHNAEEYKNVIKNYVYGSLEYPFETLELSVLDPFSRIDVTEDEKKIPSHYIKNISFKIKNKDYSVDFDTGLNSIVGKRASGKSLLLSIIQKMSDISNKQLDKYYDKGSKKTPWVPVESIKCTLMDGTVLKAGQLQSIEYIDQNSIKEIFDNPDKASEIIQSYFPVLPEIDVEPLNKVIYLLKTIKPFNRNYKSFTTYLNSEKQFNSYAFKKVNSINYSKIQGLFTNLSNSFSNIVDELSNIGFSTVRIKQLQSESDKLNLYYKEMVNQYNALFYDINIKITDMSDSTTATQKEKEASRKDFSVSKELIFSNFDILLNTKKAIHLIEKFHVNIPPIILTRKSKYMFITHYDIKEDLKDLLISSIQDLLKNTKKKGSSILIDYINEIAVLKSGINDLWSKLDAKFITDNIGVKKSFYAINQDFDLSKISRLEDIYSKVSTGDISDISNSSLGDQSSVYLELMLELEQSILLFDQPEDNVDNDYISNNFVPLLKSQKKTKQLIFVTHNPSVAVYTDSFNYIYCTNEKEIEYKNYFIERFSDRERILDILDGGSKSFSNRNRKYGNIIGEYK
jgi:ABC-type lipoprotein export system ATPase subunit